MKMMILLSLTLAACLLSAGCAPEPDPESPASMAQEKPKAGDVRDTSSPADEPKEEEPPAAEPPAAADDGPETENVPSPSPEETPEPDMEEESEGEPEEAADEPMPSYKKAIAAFNEVKAGDKACEQSDIDTAIKHYEKALKLAPEAPKHRYTYAQMLYWKGLSYMQQSQTDFQKSLGASAGESMGEWLKSPATLSDKEKKELEKKNEECRRRGKLYFEKTLKELIRCDVAWNYAVEAVPFAKGIVLVMMDRFDEAKSEFKRVLDSARIEDDMKQKIKGVIELIDKSLKERKEKDAESGKKEGE